MVTAKSHGERVGPKKSLRGVIVFLASMCTLFLGVGVLFEMSEFTFACSPIRLRVVESWGSGKDVILWIVVPAISTSLLSLPKESWADVEHLLLVKKGNSEKFDVEISKGLIYLFFNLQFLFSFSFFEI